MKGDKPREWVILTSLDAHKQFDMAIKAWSVAEETKKRKERMRPQAKQQAKKLIFKFFHLRKRPLITFWKDISYAKKCARLAIEMVMEAQENEKSFHDEMLDVVLEEIDKCPWFNLNKW